MQSSSLFLVVLVDFALDESDECACEPAKYQVDTDGKEGGNIKVACFAQLASWEDASKRTEIVVRGTKYKINEWSTGVCRKYEQKDPK